MKRSAFLTLAVLAATLLLSGEASRPAVALESTSPVIFADCTYPATDCCNPLCKPMLTACCAANSCGLPVADVVRSRYGPEAQVCTNSAEVQAADQSKASRRATPAPTARPRGE